LAVAFVGLPVPVAWAGVFDMPQFVAPASFSVGIEPEVILTSGAGLGVNVKYTHGISDLVNVMAALGTGSGPRRFRAGGGAVLDVFPDYGHQPGIGVGFHVFYYRVRPSQVLGITDVTVAELDATATPYIHKSFEAGKTAGRFDPFVSVPVGLRLSEGSYRPFAAVALGSVFMPTDNLRYVVELGVAIQNTDSYLAGGISYYH